MVARSIGPLDSSGKAAAASPVAEKAGAWRALDQYQDSNYGAKEVVEIAKDFSFSTSARSTLATQSISLATSARLHRDLTCCLCRQMSL